MRTPTPRQAERLHPLAGGYAILHPKRGEWIGLLRSGWVERIDDSTPRGGFLPPLRITPEGLAALATANPTEKGTPCISTTSGRTSRRPAASGLRSLDSVSSFTGSISPPPAALPRRCSSVCDAPSLTLPRLMVVSADAVADELAEEWARADHRRAMREPRRRSHGSTMRCPACKLFVSSSRRCSCGYTPGVGWAA